MSRALLLVPSLCVLAFAGPLSAAISAASATPAQGATAPASGGWSLSDADRAGVRALADQAVALGLPDAKGGEFRTGTLKQKDKPDPDGRNHMRMHSGFDMFSPGFASSREGDIQTWTGIHIRLPDGTWLANLSTPVGKDADDSGIDAQRLEPAQVVSAIAARLPKRMREQVDQDAADHGLPDAMIPYFRALKPLVPLMVFTQLGRHGFPSSDDAERPIPSELLFLRLGIPDAELLILGDVLQYIFGDDGSDDAKAPPLVLGDGNRHHHHRHMTTNVTLDRDDRQKRLGERLAALQATPQLRKILIAWFTDELIDGDAGRLKTDRAAAALRALTGTESDLPPETARRVELLVGRAALPATAAATAPLAARLALWEPRGEDDDHQMSDDDLAQMPAQMRAHFLARRKPVIAIAESERDAVIALLSDTGPSRWLDGNEYGGERVPRTLGDNALRYLASDFGCDPRLLMGRDPNAPWTDAERADTAKAFATWWATNKAKPKDELIGAVIGSLPLGTALALIEKKPKPERAGLIAKIAAAWTQKAPDPDTDAIDLAKALKLFGENADIRRLALAWPVTGQRRLVLAVFHDLHGDPAPLDTAIAAGFAATGNRHGGDDAIDLDDAIGLCAARPTPARLQRLLDTAAGPLENPQTSTLLREALFSRISTPHQVQELLPDTDRMGGPFGGDADKPDDGKEHAVPRALMAAFLADTRVFPAGTLSFESHESGQHRYHMLNVKTEHGSMGTGFSDDELPASAKAPGGKLEVRADWRVCDFAARAVRSNPWQFGLDMDHRRRAPAFDLFAAPADRDTRIGALRTSFTPRVIEALKAAGLPPTVPGLEAPVNKDKDALF